MKIGVLDASYVARGRSPASALRGTVAFARVAASLGVDRFWVTEHHCNSYMAGCAPEVLISRIASVTERMRVGAGAVLLPLHSPLRIAEAFRTLVALFGDRIDLGVGRATGVSDGRVLRALLNGAGVPTEDAFGERVISLLELLDDGSTGGELELMPFDVVLPEVWMLATSGRSAGVAASLGCPLAFGHYFGGAGGAGVVAAYRGRFVPSSAAARPRVSVAVAVLCAATDELASSYALPYEAFLAQDPVAVRTRFPDARQRGFDWSGGAATVFDTPGGASERARIRQSLIVGCPRRVEDQLSEVMAEYAPDEIMIHSIAADDLVARRSLELTVRAVRP